MSKLTSKFLTASAVAIASLTGTSLAAQSDLTIAIQLEPPHLDPTSAAAGAIDSVLYSNVFEGLTRFASDGSIIPGLAKSWDISADGTEYTFHLQGGVTFHDGTAMDAEDVKFSLDRARGEDSTNAQKALFSGITDVSVVDSTTVKVNLDQANGSFLFNMAWGDAVIVAPESIEGIKNNPVGTGAFKFVNWVQGDRIELARNGDYWGAAPALDAATFKFISDPTAAFAAVMAQDVDVFAGFPAPENLPQFEADARFQVLSGSTEGETILSTNNKMPPLDNVKVRKAIAHAIDRQAIIDGAMFGYGTPIGTHFAPQNPDYVDLTGIYPHDPAKSMALLKEAGYEPGALELRLALPPIPYARDGGQIVAQQLEKAGYKIKIENVEWAVWLDQVYKQKNYDLSIVSHVEPMDIGIYSNPDYYFQYDSAEFQKTMEMADAATDPAERSKYLKMAQRQIAEDAVNGYLFQLARIIIKDRGLKGIWQNSPFFVNDMRAVYWEN